MSLLRRISNLLSRVRIDREIAAELRADIDLRIVVMVMRETLALVGCGLGIGVPAAFFASRMLSSQLFGLKPGDPVTILTACATMAIVTLLASYLPARRAASVNPIQALRSEKPALHCESIRLHHTGVTGYYAAS